MDKIFWKYEIYAFANYLQMLFTVCTEQETYIIMYVCAKNVIFADISTNLGPPTTFVDIGKKVSSFLKLLLRILRRHKKTPFSPTFKKRGRSPFFPQKKIFFSYFLPLPVPVNELLGRLYSRPYNRVYIISY